LKEPFNKIGVSWRVTSPDGVRGDVVIKTILRKLRKTYKQKLYA